MKKTQQQLKSVSTHHGRPQGILISVLQYKFIQGNVNGPKCRRSPKNSFISSTFVGVQALLLLSGPFRLIVWEAYTFVCSTNICRNSSGKNRFTKSSTVEQSVFKPTFSLNEKFSDSDLAYQTDREEGQCT